MFPDGKVTNQDDFPDPGSFNSSTPMEDGYQGQNSVKMEVFHLEFPPVRVTFLTETGEVSFSSDEIPDESSLPKIPLREGMIGKWIIPRYSIEDIVIHPIYVPSKYSRYIPTVLLKKQFVEDRIDVNLVIFDSST